MIIKSRLAAGSLLGALLAAAVGTTSGASADVNVSRARRASIKAKKTQLRPAPSRRPLMHTVGSVPVLVPLPAGVRAADRGLLEVAPGFGAIHLPPSGVDAFIGAHPDLTMLTSPPRHKMLSVSHGWVHNRSFSDLGGIDGSGVVVGIIDTGLDIAHPDFLDADGNTRVAWLIERADPRGGHPGLEQKFGCTAADQSPCAIWDAADLNAALRSDPDAGPRDTDGHGTHVASIAAGNGGIVNGGNRVYKGMAPGATLVIASPAPNGGGFSDPDILNAASFIFDRAEMLGMPAVVNVSLGSDFGPHDGTSALEKGLAAMVGPDRPGRAIVVAAGNSGELYRVSEDGPFGIHTEAHVSPNATTRVVMRNPGATAELDGGGFVWVTFRPGDDVSVGLEGPDGTTWIGLTAPGDEAGFEDDNITAGVVNNLVSDRTSLTEDTNGAVVFWEGTWDGAADLAITLQGTGDAQLWIAPTGGARPGGGRLGMSFARALRAGTITVPASHKDLIAVGCTLNRLSWVPAYDTNSEISIRSFGGLDPAVADSTCYFSAAGPLPDGSMKPDILAPGGLVAGAMSRDANPAVNPNSIFANGGCPDPDEPCFVVDDWHALTSGTSMASPHVAGAIALLFALNPNLTQGELMELLQAGARRPTGVVPFDYQQGVGGLDMLGTVAVLDEMMTGTSPDFTNSYYVLSSPYARPDPTWPVQATIELRDVANAVVQGVSAKRIEVRTEGATIVDEVALVRGGMYRFSFSAPRGAGGSTVSVNVLVDGVSIGTRTLAVGVDAWAAGSGVKPVGGCACAFENSANERGAWALLALIGFAVRRRSRPGAADQR